MNEMDWKLEAQKHAACAGLLKMKLANRESELNTRIRNLENHANMIESDNILKCLMNRIVLYREEIKWIQSVIMGRSDEYE